MIRAAFVKRLVGGLRAPGAAAHRLIPSAARPVRTSRAAAVSSLSFSSTSRQQLPAESVVIDRFETGKDEDGADRLTKLSALEEEEEKGTEKTDAVPSDAAVDDDEMEQEEMFVEPHETFAFRALEWGGPRRGGRLPEPTRYGDWERKGRCTDF